MTVTDSGTQFSEALGRLALHDHIGLIYDNREDQFAAAIPYLRIGLERGERCLYIADDNSAEAVLAAMRAEGIAVDSALASGALAVLFKRDAYLKQGRFDPDWTIGFLIEATRASLAAGFSALRVTGEMTWALGEDPGVERLMEYESKLNFFFQEHRSLGMCGYHRGRFKAQAILDVLHTHPLVVCGQAVCRNPYYVPPKEFLAPNQVGRKVDRLLGSLLERERVERELLRARDALELRLQERTEELARAGRNLQAETEERRRLEDEHHSFFTITRDLLSLAASDGRIRVANPAWERMLGYGAAEVLGRREEDFVHPEDRELATRQRQRLLAGGVENVSHQNRLRAKDGSYRWFLWHSVVPPDGGLVYSSGRDITEQKRVEEALRASEERFRLLAETIPHAVWAVRPDGSVEYVNQRWLGYRGLPREEACDLDNWIQALHPEDVPRWIEVKNRAMRGEEFEIEYRLRRASDGAYRWQLERGVPVRDRDGRLQRLFGTITDIHEQIAAEQAAGLARQMPADSAKDQLRLEPVDLSALVQELADFVRPSISKGIALHLDLASDLPTLHADRGQIRQMFMNLVLNAAEAIGGAPGLISVSTGVQDVAGHPVPEGSSAPQPPPGRYVCLEVRDTGCGIDEAARARIFEPFFTTKVTGRGLGLATVAGILRAHRGAIQVSTAPGEGSCFRALFPAAEGCPVEPERPPRETRLIQEKGAILVVDDEPVVRETAKHALLHCGFEPLLAESGPAAIEVVQREADRISLVILDCSMPGMGGHQTLPELRKINPDVAVIVTSGYSEQETLRQFAGHSIAGFLQKPFTVQQLARTIQSALAQVRPPSSRP